MSGFEATLRVNLELRNQEIDFTLNIFSFTFPKPYIHYESTIQAHSLYEAQNIRSAGMHSVAWRAGCMSAEREFWQWALHND